jgi:hypothetical protein
MSCPNHVFNARFLRRDDVIGAFSGYTTTGPASNTLVRLKVMCGQFYLTVVVATIVGIKMSQALAAPRDSG